MPCMTSYTYNLILVRTGSVSVSVWLIPICKYVTFVCSSSCLLRTQQRTHTHTDITEFAAYVASTYNRHGCYSEVQVLQNTSNSNTNTIRTSLITQVNWPSLRVVLFIFQNISYYSDIIRGNKSASAINEYSFLYLYWRYITQDLRSMYAIQSLTNFVYIRPVHDRGKRRHIPQLTSIYFRKP
jgi:hypothetical protein